MSKKNLACVKRGRVSNGKDKFNWEFLKDRDAGYPHCFELHIFKVKMEEVEKEEMLTVKSNELVEVDRERDLTKAEIKAISGKDPKNLNDFEVSVIAALKKQEKDKDLKLPMVTEKVFEQQTVEKTQPRVYKVREETQKKVATIGFYANVPKHIVYKSALNYVKHHLKN